MIRHKKLICLFLTLFMIVSGMCCEDIFYTDFFFSSASSDLVYSVDYAAASPAVIKHVDSSLDTHAYFERNSLRLYENYVSVKQTERTKAMTRISSLLIALLLFIGIHLLSLLYHNSFLTADAYSNQYRQRTLEYIHHKDGKKS